MKIRIIIITFVLVFVSFFFGTKVSAQTQSTLMFAVTHYQTREDLDFLFAHSTHSIEFLERSPREGVEIPIFLSIITSSQKDEYTKAGYNPVIIDPHAGEISQYYVLSNPTGNPAYKVTGFDIIYPLNDDLTIIKVPLGKTFFEMQTGDLTKFFARQFTGDVVTPPLRTPESPDGRLPNITYAPSQSQNNTTKSSPLLWIVLVILGGFGGYFFYRRMHR